MAKYPVTEIEIASVQRWLTHSPQLAHLRVRKRGDLLILESGPSEDSTPHTRLRRLSVHLWTLEMPYRGRWQPTGLREQKDVLLQMLLDKFSWMLTPIP